jgi:DNA-binding MarR family transcriptional regulator
MTASRNREPEVDRLGREAFINLFLAAGRFTEEVEAVCKAEGLTMSHYTVLWVVCLTDEPKGVPMRIVADGLLTRAADATRLVDRLTQDGYVTRSNSEEDRRVVLVRPTRSGRALFQRVTTSVKALHRSQWNALSLAEVRELRRLLVKSLWGESDSKARHPLEALPPS